MIRDLIKGRSLIAVLSRFSLVGILATLVYLLTANTLMLTDITTPSIASMIAYCVGMVVSFFGQSRVTFLVRRNSWSQVARFVVLSVIGLAVSFISVDLISRMGTNPAWGTVVTSLSIPLISFAVMKLWVFNEPLDQAAHLEK